MSTARTRIELTSDLLIRKGYFPTELAPPFTTDQFADLLPALLSDLKALDPKWSKPILFSIPKSWPARRILSIPNPLHQTLLSESIVQVWPDLRQILEASPISLSTPTVFPNGTRAVSRLADFEEWSTERFRRSSDSRFVLRTDFSRFYHTIYTHCLSWAIHGKDVAKANRKTWDLFGNELDTRVRNTQDQQTMGLPVGPDTSFILAELIATKVDEGMESDIGPLTSVRYVDDFHLYFDNRADAEAGYASLTRVAKQYELEVNDRKTEIFEGPDTGEPPWKTALKAQRIYGKNELQRSSLISFVSKAFELAKRYPSEGVLTYAVKKAASVVFDTNSSEVYEAFLRAAIVHDSSTLPLVTRLLFDRQQQQQIIRADELRDALSKLMIFHSQLHQQYEVSWLLWVFRALKIEVPALAVQAICEMEDPFVALLTLDMRELGLAANVDTARWEAVMKSDNLYTEQWILAYEAAHQGWLPAETKYLNEDPFFGVLENVGVSFYSPPEDSGVGYVTLWTGGY